MRIDGLALHLSDDALIDVTLLLSLLSQFSQIHLQLFWWLSNKMDNAFGFIPRLLPQGESAFSCVYKLPQLSFPLLTPIVHELAYDAREALVNLCDRAVISKGVSIGRYLSTN
jgi:hypothetical protein